MLYFSPREKSQFFEDRMIGKRGRGRKSYG
jgi:hypothetical protein